MHGVFSVLKFSKVTRASCEVAYPTLSESAFPDLSLMSFSCRVRAKVKVPAAGSRWGRGETSWLPESL